MKKKLLRIALLALLTGIMGACTNDDAPAAIADAVTFTLTAPEAMRTRAVGDITGYKFTMSVYDKSTGRIVEYVEKEETGLTTTLTVSLPKGTEYECVFTMQEGRETADGTMQYYYDFDAANTYIGGTAGLTKLYIGRSTISKGGTPDATSVELTHAVAQLNIQTTASMASVKSIKVSSENVYSQIALPAGTPSETDASAPAHTVAVSGTDAASASSPVNLLSLYYLAPATETYSGASVNIELYADDAQQSLMETITVPNVPLRANYSTNIKGDLSVMSTHSFDITVGETFGGGEDVTLPLPVMGDYYYSDGTWSHDIDPAKTIIGIVVKGGRDTADDCTYMQKDGVTPMTAIRGYALALEDADGGNTYTWGSRDATIGTGAESGSTAFDGYTDTQLIKAYAADNGLALKEAFPAAYQATDGYEATYAAPAGSSGWFLPSLGQCDYWYQNGDALLAAIKKIDGKSSYSWVGAHYWSSTEDSLDSGNAWYVDFLRGGVYYGFKNIDTYRVRPLLAF